MSNVWISVAKLLPRNSSKTIKFETEGKCTFSSNIHQFQVKIFEEWRYCRLTSNVNTMFTSLRKIDRLLDHSLGIMRIQVDTWRETVSIQWAYISDGICNGCMQFTCNIRKSLTLIQLLERAFAISVRKMVAEHMIWQ